MIYTKGKAGYYMGNTDIVAAPLSDANEKNTTEHSTIFDDVFRTIAQKMPQLLIPLINEVFHTSYSEEEPFEQLRNEHYEKFGTVVTDSIIRIGNHIYHLECQSSKDKTMVIRRGWCSGTYHGIPVFAGGNHHVCDEYGHVKFYYENFISGDCKEI